MTLGRKPKYKTPKEMQRVIDLYFLAIRVNKTERTELLEGLPDEDLLIINNIDDTNPTVSGLALHLGMSRRALIDYEGKPEFLHTVREAKQRIEHALESHLYSTAVTGAIFNLKNNFKWVDKTEQDQKLSGALGIADLSGLTDEQLHAIINGKA